jgi:hypothetical protein
MSVDPLLRCGSYRGGHEVHVIQARLAWEAPPLGSGLATVDADGWISIVLDADGSAVGAVGDEPVRRWTHDPRRLAQLLGPVSGRVALREHGVLAVARAGGTALVNITDEPSPCPPPDEDTSGWTPADHVARRGGFLIVVPGPRSS